MDYRSTGNDWSIPDSGGAWLSVSRVEDFDAARDRMILAVWPGGNAEEPTETFGVNRNTPGWELLYRADAGGQQDMAAAYRWWTEVRDTPLVAAYRVLAAVGNEHRCSPGNLADQLRVPIGEVEPGGRYGRILEALMELRLVGLYVADCTFGLTRAAHWVLYPDDPASADQDWLGEALESKIAQIRPLSRAAQAFLPPGVGGGRSHQTPPPGPGQPPAHRQQGR